jgi:glucokinase
VEDLHAIGVDLGGTKILAGVVARDGSVVRRHERATPTGSQEDVLAALDAAVAELLDDSVRAIGVGAPSPIDAARGVVVRSVNLPLENVPLRDRMRDRFGLPVGLENDTNAAAIGEWRAGVGRGIDDLVLLTLGTGVGGGVISGGAPFRGRNGGGVELGHITVVHDGKPCLGACRGRGHLEAYASGSAVGDAAEVIRLANEGDSRANEVLYEVAGYLGSGIGSLVNVFAPQLVVIGGGFGLAAFDHVAGRAEEIARREALEPMRSGFRLAQAELGTDAGLIGAAFVGFGALDSSVA